MVDSKARLLGISLDTELNNNAVSVLCHYVDERIAATMGAMINDKLLLLNEIDNLAIKIGTDRALHQALEPIMCGQ